MVAPVGVDYAPEIGALVSVEILRSAHGHTALSVCGGLVEQRRVYCVLNDSLSICEHVRRVEGTRADNDFDGNDISLNYGRCVAGWRCANHGVSICLGPISVAAIPQRQSHRRLYDVCTRLRMQNHESWSGCGSDLAVLRLDQSG